MPDSCSMDNKNTGILTDTYNGFIERYIPSEDMKETVREQQFAFSDREKAAIVWNSSFPMHEKHEDLKTIAELTSDYTLKQQISERLEYDNDALECFKKNSGDIVYALTVYEEYPSIEGESIEIEKNNQGFFGSYDVAYKTGISTNCRFEIEKHQIINENTEIIKGRNHTSPLMQPDEEKQIEEVDGTGHPVGNIEFDKQGRILNLYTVELSKERDLLVNTLSNKRFENAFVAFPNPFKLNDHVMVVQSGELCREGEIGWIGTSEQDWEEQATRARQEDAYHDWSDASLIVDYWDEESLTWRYGHLNIHCLERIEDHYCNSYTKDHPILIGHDGGDSTWIQAVNVRISDRITTEDVEEIGKEISIRNSFFWRVLGRLFKEYFDPGLIANKNRFTRAFEEEGRFLKAFEYDILEYNFYTYEDMNRIINRIEAGIKSGGRLISQWLEEDNDVTQLLTLAAHLHEIMEESPDADYISVMS